jgi:hypothetical protein
MILLYNMRKALSNIMANDRHDELKATVTADVTEHARDLAKLYAARYGVSRQAANQWIRRLEDEGWIARSGPRTHPTYSPGYRRQVARSYPLRGLDEQTPWERDFAPFFALKPNVRGIVHHGFTEIVNNAIDHSEGRRVSCHIDQDGDSISLAVLDDGIGIFRKIATALKLHDARLSLLELSKGKLTTDPSRHTGEGVFFTSRMFDHFVIQANGLEYEHRALQGDESRPDFLREGDDTERGTLVYMHISTRSERTAQSVFDQFTSGPQDFTFAKTVVPIQLGRLGDEQLVSRSQAKRLIARFDRFRTVVLDFNGVDEIGQAFADELFRVYANQHPQVELQPIHMSEQVERMYLRSVAPRL